MRKVYQLLILLALQFVLFKYITQHPVWIEQVYIPKVFSPLTLTLRNLTAPFSFSVGLLLIYTLGISLSIFIVKSILRLRKKQSSIHHELLFVLKWTNGLYFYYMLTWGIMYYRIPIADKFSYDTTPATKEELKYLCEDLVEKINSTRKQISTSEIAHLKTEDIFSEAVNSYNIKAKQIPFLKYKNPSIKLATGSQFIAYFGAGGIYTFWSGEANVNKIHANHDLPEVTLHEMAHQLGVASEDEANYVAWLVGKDSPNKIFQYSAYYNVVWRSLNRYWSVDSSAANLLYAKIDSTIYTDAKEANARWKSYRNIVQDYVISPFYSLFLQANGREYGIMSYDMVVDLIIQERRKQLLDFSKNP